ncbi:MAG: hypothetical protein M3132_00465 [Actinomycetia bacterium]|nr:hypothetical protein [Actinomycetes bacterium]
MNPARPPLWIDAGMAVFVAIFISIVLFVDGGVFNRVMLAYVVALCAWAFVAEGAAMRAENHGSSIASEDYTTEPPRSEPLSH